MDGLDFMEYGILFIVAGWVLSILVPVFIIRWVIRVNPRVTLLKKILVQIEQLNAKTPGRPAPQAVAVMQKTTLLAGIENIKPEKKKPSGIICTKCKTQIPVGESLHIFAGKEVCKKCDQELRKKTGLDDSVTTT